MCSMFEVYFQSWKQFDFDFAFKLFLFAVYSSSKGGLVWRSLQGDAHKANVN